LANQPLPKKESKELANDFVLIEKINDPTYYVGKIVIGTILDSKTGRTHIVVKRLIKKENAYYFRSETYLDKNSQPGKIFMEDIPITDCNQVRAVVVASAQPAG